MQALERLADAVQRLANSSASSPASAPDYQKPLELFREFDWTSIGAEVEREDSCGAAIVSWQGKQYLRRSPSNKFGEAVWFSRCTGKGDEGQNIYERLITFKPLLKVEIEPLPEKVSRLVNASRSTQKTLDSERSPSCAVFAGNHRKYTAQIELVQQATKHTFAQVQAIAKKALGYSINSPQEVQSEEDCIKLLAAMQSDHDEAPF